MRSIRVATAVLTLSVAGLAGSAKAVEHVSLKRDDKPIHVSGKVLVEGSDGGLLLLASDGVLWIIQPEEMQQRTRDESPFAMLDAKGMEQKLLADAPDGFQIHRTAHYRIAYNTSPAYAHWCGSLYERLYRAFFSYWKNRGWELEPPEYPLSAMVFRDKSTYVSYSKPELGEAAESIIGYYNMRTNRVNMYDLTGANGIGRVGRLSSAAQINQILSRPAAERTVATIVHEATHQLAYNSGLQVRYGANPFWVSEGLAVYFESPDLRSSKGWKSIGAINRFNLNQFRRRLPERGENSLLSLIGEDTRFRDPKEGPAAYAEAWALNYFLIRTRSKQYIEFVKSLAELPPLTQHEPAERVARFRKAFGGDLRKLESDFLRYMRRLR